MGIQRNIYRALKYYNDGRAITQAAKHRSAKPVVRRVGRRVYGKLTGRLARSIFG
jgi:hypothetical protein